MSDRFYIACIVILGMQASVTALRYLKRQRERSGHDAVSIVTGILVLAALVALRTDAVRDRVWGMVAPIGPQGLALLFAFFAVTTALRMLFDQFVLHLPYKAHEWLIIGAVCLLMVGSCVSHYASLGG